MLNYLEQMILLFWLGPPVRIVFYSPMMLRQSRAMPTSE